MTTQKQSPMIIVSSLNQNQQKYSNSHSTISVTRNVQRQKNFKVRTSHKQVRPKTLTSCGTYNIFDLVSVTKNKKTQQRIWVKSEGQVRSGLQSFLGSLNNEFKKPNETKDTPTPDRKSSYNVRKTKKRCASVTRTIMQPCKISPVTLSSREKYKTINSSKNGSINRSLKDYVLAELKEKKEKGRQGKSMTNKIEPWNSQIFESDYHF